MLPTITHPFVSPKADGPDATLVRPSNWNANHTSVGLPRSYLAGLGLSNDSGDLTNDIGVAVGECQDSTNVEEIILASALVKQLDNAWAVGTNQGMRDTGAISNATWHIFVIKRTDTDVVDVLASLSPTAPTMPTNYTLFRRIGSIIRSAGAILAFTQYGEWFQLNTPVEDYDATNPGTAAVTVTHTVPTGIAVDVVFNAALADTTSGDNTLLFFDGALTHPGAASTATATSGQLTLRGAAGGVWVSGQLRIRSDTAAGTKFRLEASDATRRVHVATQGWWDRLNKDA